MTGWGEVKAFLLLTLPNLSGLDELDAVWDGPAVSSGLPFNYAEVGHDGETGRGFYELDHEDVLTSESGEVMLRLTARSGETDVDALQDVVDGWVSQLQDIFHADKTLGGVLKQSSTVTVGRVDMNAAQSRDGAIVQNTVAVRYFTRL